MRLNAPISSNFVGDVDGPRADIVEQILGTAERKRSRPTSSSSSSSLDFKVDRLKQTRPPSRSQQQEKHRKSQQRRKKSTSHPRETTRRGGGDGGRGIPPPKFDLSDLEGMTEEQLRMAYAADPELAAAAAAAASAENADFSAKRKKYKSPYYRNKHGHVESINDYPAHLQSMMEEGIPVKQWFILLVLFGAGLYQLRKSMLGPTVERGSKKTSTTAPLLPKKASRKVGNKKGKKIIGSSSSPPVKERNVVQSQEKLSPPLLEKEPANGKELVASVMDATQAKAAKKKRRPTKQNVQQEETTKDESRQSPDGSSAAELVVDRSDHNHSGKTEALNHVREEPESVEWQTVGKASASAENPQRKNGNKAQYAVLVKKDPVEEVPNATSSKEEVVEPAVKPTKKKKKKNKVANTSTLADTPAQEVVSTQDDEALAMKLQQQEEKLAAADACPVSEDDWASVTPKKAKRKNQTETETSDA